MSLSSRVQTVVVTQLSFFCWTSQCRRSWRRKKRERGMRTGAELSQKPLLQSDLVVLLRIIWITAPAPNKLISNSNFKPNYWAWWRMKLLIERKNSLQLWLAEQHHMTGCTTLATSLLSGGDLGDVACSPVSAPRLQRFFALCCHFRGKNGSSARCWHQNWRLISAHLFTFALDGLVVMFIDWKTKTNRCQVKMHHAHRLMIHKGCGD